MPELIRLYGFAIPMVRCRTIYPVILLLFWFSVFTYVIVGVRQTSSTRDTEIQEFDDVRSNIMGALTHDDVIETSDDIITNNDDVAHIHIELDSTTRATLEIENHEHLQVNMHSGYVGDARFSEHENENVSPEDNNSYPHGDLKLPDSENENVNYMNELRELIYPQDKTSDSGNKSQWQADRAAHYDVTMQAMGDGALKFDVGHVVDQDSAIPGNPDDTISEKEKSLFLEKTGMADGDFHKIVDLDPGRFSTQVTNHMIDHFQVKLPPLLEGYKNPCWLEEIPEDFTYDDSYFNTCNTRMGTGEVRYKGRFEAFKEQVLDKRSRFGAHWRVRCFPYFFLLGVGKCGTTDLFMTLKTYARHLAPIFLKEPHFWEWKRCHPKMHCHGRRRNPTLGEYLDALDPAAERIRQEKTVMANGTEYHPLIIGDFTPSTMNFYPCWQNQPGNTGSPEPRYLTPHYIHSIRPQTKFIAIMRDPVERIFSNYKMKFRLSNHQGDENAKLFHTEMLNATTYFTECMTTNTPRACAFSVMRFDFMTHVSNSMYEIFIRDWLSVFPRDQFLFLRMEDYMESRVPNIKAILKLLDLEELSPLQEQEVASKEVNNKAPETEGMFEETRELLQDFFRPFNGRLVDLLGNEGFKWGY